MNEPLAAIALRLGGTVRGDGSVIVRDIAAVDDAGNGSLTFATDERYLRAALASRAIAVLTEPSVAGEATARKPLLLVESARAALAALLEELEPPRPSGASRHPSAVVDASAHVGAEVAIGPHVVIGANASIGAGTKIDNLVQIGHNCRIGHDCAFAAQTGLAGSTVVGDHVMVGGQSAFKGHVRVGSGVRIAGASHIWGDIPDGAFVSGQPAHDHREELRLQVRIRNLGALYERVEALEQKR